MRLKDKVALITGSGAGIGREISLAFAREGADVIANDINFEAAGLVAKEIEQIGRKSLPQKADISKTDEIRAMVTKAIDVFGKIDILVNNAAISDTSGNVEKIPFERWDSMIRVTLSGAFYCSQLVGREMIKRRSGKIVNISSLGGLVAIPLAADYVAAKHGIIGLTKALAIEWAKYGITVNAICPGMTDSLTTQTDLETYPGYKEILSTRIARIPMGRIAVPADQANAAVFLASPEANYITGSILVVDGGSYALHSGYPIA
jgi:NAD(P)-dependent dehydrogenase (short-subunit alcohol dehydrogenase family)